MLIAILLVALWIAVLTPIVVRHFRDRDTDRSILNFHERMARLSGNSETLIEPAHRLDVSDELPPRPVYEYEANPPIRAPRLRVVPLDATPADLERELSWDEWSDQYADDPYERSVTAAYDADPRMQRAAAYAHAPVSSPFPSTYRVTDVTSEPPVSPYGSRSQRQRRRRVLLRLVSAAIVTTLATIATGWFFVEALMVLSWVGLLGFLGLMYYAVTTGMMSRPNSTTTLQTRRAPQARYNAPAPSEMSYDDRYAAYEDDRYASTYDEPRYARAQ